MSAQIDPPNYTQTPNVLLEVWMSKLSGAEFKVLMLIVRETFGWRREWTKNKYATQAAIVTATGLSIGSVKLALTKLLALGLIESRSTGKVGRGGQGLEYRLMVNGQPLTDNGYPIKDDAQPPAYGSMVDPPLYIQNKERVNKESTPVGEGANDAPSGDSPAPTHAPTATLAAALPPEDSRAARRDQRHALGLQIAEDVGKKPEAAVYKRGKQAGQLNAEFGGMAGDVCKAAGGSYAAAFLVWDAFRDTIPADQWERFGSIGAVETRFARWKANGGAGTIAEIVALVEAQGGAT